MNRRIHHTCGTQHECGTQQAPYSPGVIAGMIGGTLVRQGGKTCRISAGAYFEDARKNEITYAARPALLKNLSGTRAGAVIVPKGTWAKIGSRSDAGLPDTALIESDRPKHDFFRVLTLLYPGRNRTDAGMAGVSDQAAIGKGCRIETGVSIAAFVHVGDHVVLGKNVTLLPGVVVADGCAIGADTVLQPNVTILGHTVIGRGCRIQSGTVIGSDDFDFSIPESSSDPVPLGAGYVEIGDGVDIGANNAIDRGSVGRTRIGRGVKTANLVHISHNVIVGENSFILAHTCIAGRTIIGRNVIIGAQVALSGGLVIGDGAVVGSTSNVAKNVAPGETVLGCYPALPRMLSLRVASVIPKLVETRRSVLALEEKVALMKKTGNGATDSYEQQIDTPPQGEK